MIEEEDSNHDDTRSEESVPQTDDNADRVSDDLGGPTAAPESTDLTVGRRANSSSEDDSVEIEGTESLEEDAQEVLAEVGLEALVSSRSRGPIPQAEELYKYQPEDRERIFGMAEAPTTDESRRRDRLVDAQVVVAKRSQWIQAGITIGCIASALLVMLVTGSAWGAAFLSGPIIQALGVPIQSIAESRGKDKEAD